MNLLDETLSFLQRHGLTEEDVCWVGDGVNYCSWNDFVGIANVEYDAGYGIQEIEEDLIVVGKDWWLERHEYDGSEWWEFKKLPEKPKKEPSTFRIMYRKL